jgi:hypothetical protein
MLESDIPLQIAVGRPNQPAAPRTSKAICVTTEMSGNNDDEMSR